MCPFSSLPFPVAQLPASCLDSLEFLVLRDAHDAGRGGDANDDHGDDNDNDDY